MGGLGALNARLHGKLWHTTSPDLFPKIMASGCLMPEPDIDNTRRWKTSCGPDFYPFVRKMGGVSLFDFEDFDSKAYCNEYPLSTWRTFVPYVKAWRGAVWIEIDRARVTKKFWSAKKVLCRWHEEGQLQRTIMPMIEAACIGNVPCEVFSSAFLTWASGERVSEIGLAPFDAVEFARQLDEWRLGSA